MQYLNKYDHTSLDAISSGLSALVKKMYFCYQIISVILHINGHPGSLSSFILIPSDWQSHYRAHPDMHRHRFRCKRMHQTVAPCSAPT